MIVVHDSDAFARCRHQCCVLYQLTEDGASGRHGVNAAPAAVVAESLSVTEPAHIRVLLSARNFVTATRSTLVRVSEYASQVMLWIAWYRTGTKILSSPSLVELFAPEKTGKIHPEQVDFRFATQFPVWLC